MLDGAAVPGALDSEGGRAGVDVPAPALPEGWVVDDDGSEDEATEGAAAADTTPFSQGFGGEPIVQMKSRPSRREKWM